MEITLHAIGDVHFLARVLNGVALLFGSADLKTAAGIGGLVGVLLMALRALLSLDGRAPQLAEFLASLLLWLLLFEPRTTVRIEDIFRGETQVVANVPLGPAAAGAVISTLGLGLTSLFETAFSTPAMTRTGYAGSLETLLHIRRQLRNALLEGRLEAPGSPVSLAASIEAYVADCTLTGVDLGRTPIQDLLRHRSLPGALRYDSDLYTTRLQDGLEPSRLSCRAAWPRLERLFEVGEAAALEEIERALSPDINGGDARGRIQSALDAVSQGQIAAGDYLLAGVLVPLFEQGIRARQLEGGEAGRIAVIESALQQRNTQWAAEQTLFSRLVRPVLTWIEGFSFAVTPLMAFAVFLGSPGIRLCGQYTRMLLWIQCWMPILAVANLYLTLAAEGGLAALAAMPGLQDSVAGYQAMALELQNWVAVGGMLASATPAIALMLVYGGSVTATHFLGRLQGGDFIDEKVLAPAVATTAPLLSDESRVRQTPLGGLSVMGAEQLLPSFRLDQGESRSEGNSRRATQLASQRFFEEIRQGASESQGWTNESHQGQRLNDHVGHHFGHTEQFLKQTGDSLAERYRHSGVNGEAMTTLLQGALQGHFGSGSSAAGLQAGLSSALQNRYQLSEESATEMASDLTQQLSHHSGFDRGLAQAISRDLDSGRSEIASLGLRSDHLNGVARAAESLETQEASRTENHESHHGSRTEVSIGAREVGTRFGQHPPLQQALDRALNVVGLSGDAERLAEEWRHQGLIRNPEAAYAAAGLSLLTGHSTPVYHPLNAEEATLAQTLGRTLIADAFRGPDHLEYPLGSALQPPDPSLKERVNERLEETIETDARAIEREQRLRQAAVDQQLSEDPQRQQAFERDSQDRLNHGRDLLSASVDRVRQDRLEAQMAEALDQMGPAGALTETLATGLRKTRDRLETALDGPLEGALSALEAWSKDPKAPSSEVEASNRAIPTPIDRIIDEAVQQRLEALAGILTPGQRAYVAARLGSDLGKTAADEALGKARDQLFAESETSGPTLVRLLDRLAEGGPPSLAALLQQWNARVTRISPPPQSPHSK